MPPEPCIRMTTGSLPVPWATRSWPATVTALPSLPARKSESLTVIVGMACSSVRGAMSAVDVGV